MASKYEINVSYLLAVEKMVVGVHSQKFERNISKNDEDMANRRLRVRLTVCWLISILHVNVTCIHVYMYTCLSYM